MHTSNLFDFLYLQLGRVICRRCLPIKCLEAVIVALYLLLPFTTGVRDQAEERGRERSRERGRERGRERANTPPSLPAFLSLPPLSPPSLCLPDFLLSLSLALSVSCPLLLLLLLFPPLPPLHHSLIGFQSASSRGFGATATSTLCSACTAAGASEPSASHAACTSCTSRAPSPPSLPSFASTSSGMRRLGTRCCACGSGCRSRRAGTARRPSRGDTSLW